MKKILITNDDGIESDGLIRLVKEAIKYGEVLVVAPVEQRSASSHCISLHSPIDIFPHAFPVEGVKAYSCRGTPADCIRVGSVFIMTEKPDIVLSGINYGYNSATDIQYSGTCGAAFEGDPFPTARYIISISRAALFPHAAVYSVTWLYPAANSTQTVIRRSKNFPVTGSASWSTVFIRR